MIEHELPLALAFLKAQPEVAAQILEQSPMNQVVDFIANTPADYCTDIFRCMLPSYAARLCKALTVDDAIKILTTLGSVHASTIIRYFDKSYRNQILRELPTKTSLEFQLLLRFSQNTVGAWITEKIAITTPESTLGDTITGLSDRESLAPTNCIFVISRDKQYQGRLHYLDLLVNKSDELVSHYMKPALGNILSAQMSINKASQHKGWNRYEALPVIDRKKNFLGVLTHLNLRKAMIQTENQTPERKGKDSLTGIAEVYGDTLASIFKAMGDVVQSDMRQ